MDYEVCVDSGVYPIDAELCDGADGNMIEQVGTQYPTYYHGKGRGWHVSQVEAVEYAKKMRDKKIASMKKKIKKLEGMTFE